MRFNLWMGFDDRAQSKAKEPDANGNFSDALLALGDVTTPTIYREDDPPGPRTYQLWSLYGEADDDQGVRDARNALNATYPGQLRTIAAFWTEEGNMVGTENTYHTHTETQTWSVLNPDYNPVTADEAIVQWEEENPQPIHPPDPAPDATPEEVAQWQIEHDAWEAANVIWLSDRAAAYTAFDAAYDPRYTIQVTGEVEVTHVDGHTGNPIFPVHNSILEYMPDVDDVGTRPTEATDVNLKMGQVKRNFL